MKSLFDKNVKFIAEPGPFFCGAVGDTRHARSSGGRSQQQTFYYLNDGVYADFSGIVFDHCQYEYKTFAGARIPGARRRADLRSFDTLSTSAEIPELYLGDVVTSELGAYSSASATPRVQRFLPAKIILV